MPSTKPGVAIVIVTYNRPDYLDSLLDSVTRMTVGPEKVIVVDNASAQRTADVLASWAERLPAGLLVIRRLETNTGGSGGYSEGARLALELGMDWAWLMDDDVEILPDALERLTPWMERFKVIHGRRYDVDGTPFYWQARFNQFLGVPLPYTLRAFNRDGYAITNSGTFEGMLVATDVVRKIGLPDPRFFISWDDAIYAWLASQITDVVYVDEFVLQKKRPQRQVNLGLRHLNDSSPMVKFHVMRNRAYVGRYFDEHDHLNRVGFGLGTALTLGKEFFRMVVVEHSTKGTRGLLDGVAAGRKIWHDKTWEPMPPVPVGAEGTSPADAGRPAE